MGASNMSIESYPDWYKIERDTEKIIKKLTTLKELLPYLNNSDEYIRRLSIIRINELRLKDSIIALKELLDDPLESLGNKELAAWTIKVVSDHWNADVFITSKYLNNYSGKERYEDICRINIKDTLPSLRFDFTSSMLNSELNIERTDIRSSKDIEIDLPFSVKEWFGQYSNDIIADLKVLLIKLPLLLFKGLKCSVVFVFGGLVYISKTLFENISKIKNSTRKKSESKHCAIEKTSDAQDTATHNHKARNSKAGEFGSLRDSFDDSAFKNPYKEELSLKERVKKAALSIAYLLFSPIRFIIQHKKLTIIGLAAIYCFLCFFPYGKALTYKYTGVDLMDEQTKAFKSAKGIVTYVWDEINEILDIGTTPQPVVAQTDAEPTTGFNDIVQSKYVITAKTGLNLREKPNSSSKKLLQLPYESIVTKEAENGSWYKIKTSDGMSGWVSSKYLKEYRGE